METAILGSRGQLTIPKNIRKKFNMLPNSPVVIEIKEDGIMIKPSTIIELRIFPEEMINNIISENRYKDDNERTELLKNWGIDDKDIS